MREFYRASARLLDGTMAGPLKPRPYTGPRIYDESVDFADQVNAAIFAAKKEKKRVLLQFGANWCSWCHKLHKLFEADAVIREKLRANFIVVMVDTDKKQNRDLTAKYGGEKMGIPLVVILDAEGEHLVTKNTAELEEGDHHDPKKVLSFLSQWAAR